MRKTGSEKEDSSANRRARPSTQTGHYDLVSGNRCFLFFALVAFRVSGLIVTLAAKPTVSSVTDRAGEPLHAVPSA